jgi:hypothetical protein
MAAGGAYQGDQAEKRAADQDHDSGYQAENRAENRPADEDYYPGYQVENRPADLG